MKEIQGNILDITQGIIVQQVNCAGVMGAGLALQIKKRWPKVFKDYQQHLEFYRQRPQHPLGTINATPLGGGLTLYNFYSQDKYGRTGRHTNYEAFEKCLLELVCRFKNSKIEVGDIPVYFPYGIGCGLAGGSWTIISRLISKYFPEATIVKLQEE